MTQQYGGVHSTTASLNNALALEGVLNPKTGKPFTEAMILGIGGGLGAGYILWEYKKRDYANIVMGFRNRWNYPLDYLTNACGRLGIILDVLETTSINKAQISIDEALEQGKPILVWTDKACIVYHGLLEEHKRHFFYIIGVQGKTDDGYAIDDLHRNGWTLTKEEFIEAHTPIVTSNKQRTITLDPTDKIDLKAAVMAGIQDHLEHLGRNSESFSLPVYTKWAKLMVDPKNKKGWPTVFKKRAGLYVTLRSIYEGVAFDDTEGAALRDLYADFLTEADTIIDADLSEAVDAYRTCAEAWREFANTALPDDVPEFVHSKELMQERYSNFAKQDVGALTKNVQELSDLEGQYNKEDFPLNDDQVTELFEAMHNQLNAIYDAEQAALQNLNSAIES